MKHVRVRTGRQKYDVLAVCSTLYYTCDRMFYSGKPPNIKNWHIIAVCTPENSTKQIITLINHSDSSESANLLSWFVHTLATGAALVWPEHRICAAGSRAGDEDTHLPSSMAVTVPAAIMPALALFKLLAIGSQTLSVHWGRSGSANTTLTL